MTDLDRWITGEGEPRDWRGRFEPRSVWLQVDGRKPRRMASGLSAAEAEHAASDLLAEMVSRGWEVEHHGDDQVTLWRMRNGEAIGSACVWAGE